MVTSLMRVETHVTMTLHSLYFFHYPHPVAHQRTNYTALEGRNTYMAYRAYMLTGLQGLRAYGLTGIKAYRVTGLTCLQGLQGLKAYMLTGLQSLRVYGLTGSTGWIILAAGHRPLYKNNSRT